MFAQNGHPSGIAGPWGVGPGIASYTGWIVAFVIVFVLAWLAWWAMRPARRTARSKRTENRREPDRVMPPDPHDDNLTRTNQTRKTR